MGTSKLGNMLVEDGLLSESDRRTIKRTCGTSGSAFARGILAMGLLDEDELAAYIADHTSWQVAQKNLLDTIQSGAWGCIDRPLVEQLEVLPLRLNGETLLVAMVDPLDQDTISQLEFFTGYKIQPVIATMSQVRGGLQKVMPDYKASNSHLEDFLKNHSISASKRLLMAEETLYSDLPAPETFSIKPSSSKGRGSQNGLVERSAAEQAEVDQIEFDTDDEEVSFLDEPAATEAPKQSVAPLVEDLGDELEANDDLFAIEDDGLGGDLITDDDSLLEEQSAMGTDDDLSDIDDPMLDPDLEDTGVTAQAPAQSKKTSTLPEGADDLESLVDLDDLEPEAGDLDFPSPAMLAAEKPAASAKPSLIELDENVSDEELLADFGANDSLGESNDDDLLFDEAPKGKKEEPNPTDDFLSAADDELSGELSADFSAMELDDGETLAESTDDLLASNNDDLLASSGEDDFNADFAADDAASASAVHTNELSDELLELDNQISVADSLAADDDLLGDDLDIAAEASALPATTGNSDTGSDENTDGNVSTDSEQVSSAINKMLFSVTMSLATKDAISSIAPDLKSTGFSTGMVMSSMQGKDFHPECGWQDNEGATAQGALTAEALKAKGIKAALTRLTGQWSVLDDAVRQGDLKIFAGLQRENRKLFGIRFSDAKGNETVIVTAMTAEIAQNSEILDMATDLFRQVAEKDKSVA